MRRMNQVLEHLESRYIVLWTRQPTTQCCQNLALFYYPSCLSNFTKWLTMTHTWHCFWNNLVLNFGIYFRILPFLRSLIFATALLQLIKPYFSFQWIYLCFKKKFHGRGLLVETVGVKFVFISLYPELFCLYSELTVH